MNTKNVATYTVGLLVTRWVTKPQIGTCLSKLRGVISRYKLKPILILSSKHKSLVGTMATNLGYEVKYFTDLKTLDFVLQLDMLLVIKTNKCQVDCEKYRCGDTDEHFLPIEIQTVQRQPVREIPNKGPRNYAIDAFKERFHKHENELDPYSNMDLTLPSVRRVPYKGIRIRMVNPRSNMMGV